MLKETSVKILNSLKPGIIILTILAFALSALPLFAADKKLRIIMIGDSVMRLQRDYLKQHLDGASFNITFMERRNKPYVFYHIKITVS